MSIHSITVHYCALAVFVKIVDDVHKTTNQCNDYVSACHNELHHPLKRQNVAS